VQNPCIKTEEISTTKQVYQPWWKRAMKKIAWARDSDAYLEKKKAVPYNRVWRELEVETKQKGVLRNMLP